MSTPISRDNKLAGLDLYAPRRARTPSAPEEQPTRSPITPPGEENEEPLASDSDAWWTHAVAADVQAQLDDAIRVVIKTAHTRDSAPPAPVTPIGSAAPSMLLLESIIWPPPSSDLWRHLTHAALLSYSRLDPQVVPNPPVPASVQRRGVSPMLVRLSPAVVAAAIVAYGFMEISSLRPMPINSDQATALLQRGQELLRTGDIAAARLAFQRLADSGNAEAALALGASFDPHYLARRHVIGVVGDEAKARASYQRAMELGSTDAKKILARMATN
ncbi:MAG TPA: hypothetical protein VGJ20_31535 [Xanthobacteraceae bacterium]